MREPRETGSDETEALRRAKALGEEIARARGNRQAESEPGRVGAATDVTLLSRGLRLGTEFIAAILVGAVAGYLLDQWLKTAPWIMLVMLLIGFAAGVLNMARAVAEMNKASPPPLGSDLGPGDDEDDQ